MPKTYHQETQHRPTEQITLKLPPAMLDLLNRFCIATGASRGYVIRCAITDYIKPTVP